MERVPDEYMNCVVFLCFQYEDDLGNVNRVPQATAFFVNYPIGDLGSMPYLVTARHCIEEPLADGHEKVYVRVNLKSGGYGEMEARLQDWYLHDSADIAVIPCSTDVIPSRVRVSLTASIRTDSFVKGAPHYEYEGKVDYLDEPVVIQPTVGHQVYFPGLFTLNYGHEQNLPIARFGHISRMPSVVEIKRPGGIWARNIAYLVEFQSWGGHSGSPVFFMYPMVLNVQTKSNEGDKFTADLMWVNGLMGVVSGHYDINRKAKTTGDILGIVETQHNSGIAMVTPADAINQLLEREDVVNHREELKKKIKEQRPAPTLDIDAGGDEFTESDFEKALQQVSRRVVPSEPDEASSET